MSLVQMMIIVFVTVLIFSVLFLLFTMEMKKDISLLRKDIACLKKELLPDGYSKNSKSLIVNELFIQFLDTISHEEHTIHIIEDKCEKSGNDEFKM